MSMIILNQDTYLYLWTTSNLHMVEAYILNIKCKTTLSFNPSDSPVSELWYWLVC